MKAEGEIPIPVLWFRKEWIDTNAKALGVYVALLLVRFRVRLRTDIPALYSEEGKIEGRLKPYLSIFLRDKDKKLIDVAAIDAGKEFFMRLVDHTAYQDYEDVLDCIETDFYETFKEAYLGYVNANVNATVTVTVTGKEFTGEISPRHDTAALIRTFLRDVSANRFSKGKVTPAGSSILLTPFGELMEFYGLSEEDVQRFLKILRMTGIMFFDVVPAPVLEREFVDGLST